MAAARVCLLLVILINVCPDQVLGQPLFGDLLSWLYDDYDDDTNSTSTDDYNDWGWWDWACANCNRRRSTTTARPTTLPMRGQRPGSVNLITQEKMNITVSNEGSLLTLIVSPWDGSAPSSTTGGTTGSTTAAPGGATSSTAAPTTAGSTTAGPTTAGSTTEATTTTAATTTAAA